MNASPVPFALGIVAIGAVALALRLVRLEQRPMHADEANQAVRAALLRETGEYRYDPADHHGPGLYYLTQPSLWLAGATDCAHSCERDYRAVTVVFGAGLILLLLLVGDGLGRYEALTAGLLTAISPAMFFYSRCYIQETLLVFFTFMAVGCGWRWLHRQSWGWAIACGVALGMMHATKETWILAGAAMIGAVGVAAARPWYSPGASPSAHRRVRVCHCLQRLRERFQAKRGTACRKPSTVRQPASSAARHPTQPVPAASSGTPRFSSPTHATLLWARRRVRPGPIAAALAAAILTVVVFYSSFGGNGRGPLDSLLAYASYVERGSQGGAHAHPWYYYLHLLLAYRPARGFFWSEALILVLAMPAVAAAWLGRGLTQTSTAFCRFLAVYAVLLTAIYCLIPYKTPWCLLSFWHAMILLAGVGTCAVFRWLPGTVSRAVAGGVLALGLAHLGWQCHALNFRLYADQRNPYVYAHTSTDVLNLSRQMERLAAASPDGHRMTIHVVVSENYWSLPWYLRKFSRQHVGYWEGADAWVRDAARHPVPSVLIFGADLQSTVDASLRGSYNRQMIFGLRPGVLLHVYVREGLWHAFLSQQDWLRDEPR